MTTFENAHHRLNSTRRTNSKFGIWSSRGRHPDVVVEPDEVGRDRVVDPEVLGPEVRERHPDLEDQRVERDDRHHGRAPAPGTGRATGVAASPCPWRGIGATAAVVAIPGCSSSWRRALGRSGYGQRIGPGPGSAQRWSTGRGRSGGAAMGAPGRMREAKATCRSPRSWSRRPSRRPRPDRRPLSRTWFSASPKGPQKLSNCGALRPGEARGGRIGEALDDGVR